MNDPVSNMVSGVVINSVSGSRKSVSAGNGNTNFGEFCKSNGLDASTCVLRNDGEDDTTNTSAVLKENFRVVVVPTKATGSCA